MILTALDKVFGHFLIESYGNKLNEIGVTQAMDLRAAFYAGARVMVAATTEEPPLTNEQGQQILDNISGFQEHIRNKQHNRIVAAAILVQAQMKINGASTN